MFDLAEAVARSPRTLVVPLMGFPGANLTQTSLRDNLFDAETHASSILALANTHRPDMVFPMMDLAVEAGALGVHVDFPENDSPTVIEHPVRRVSDLARFRDADILTHPRLVSFLETLRHLRKALDIPVAAYVTGPFTLAGLLIGAKQIAEATIEDPTLPLKTLDLTTRIISSYAAACVDAGADLIAYLEPMAVMLSPDSFEQFSGVFVSKILSQLDVPGVLHICGDSTHLIPNMCSTGVQGLSLDAVISLPALRKIVPSDIVLMGNIDPVSPMAVGSVGDVWSDVTRLRREMEGARNFVLSTGCDLPLDTPQANIAAFMDAGRALIENHAEGRD
jgi:uroporphyrinogen decarboxylase